MSGLSRRARHLFRGTGHVEQHVDHNARLGRGDLRPRGDLGGHGQGRALHLSEDSKLPYGQVLKALVSVIVSKILFCGLTYVLTTLVSVSVTVSVTSTLVNPAAKNQ